MRKLLKMLEQRGIGEDEAIKYIEKSIPFKRTWKMWRFTLYLWKRVENDKKGIIKNRIETVAEVVHMPKYKRLYDTFPLLPLDKEKEIKNLTQLIAEPRQSKEFKSKNFFYEGTKKNIPQSLIDKLR
ncbi:MAG: hypothetical protein ACKVI2_03830 [Candidatus Pelagibacterales bacterium]|jgi:hypothetical protein|tara:strand:+ start:958 stop:1338 length:381 start_codon:yes stop_codon:yes gene_type:complete